MTSCRNLKYWDYESSRAPQFGDGLRRWRDSFSPD